MSGGSPRKRAECTNAFRTLFADAWHDPSVGRFRIDRLCRVVREVADVDGNLVVARCHVADRWPARLVGLLGTPRSRRRRGPVAGAVLVGAHRRDADPDRVRIPRRDGRVLRVVDPLPAWRHAAVRGARAVVEGRAGRFAGLAVGTTLTPRSPTKMSA